MKTLFCFLIALTASFSTLATQTVGETPTAISIPFKPSSSSALVVVPLQLNGHLAYFLVDCGSEMTILEQSTADAFGFSIDTDNDSQNVDWSGNSVNVSTAKYATIQIGSLKIGQDLKVANIRNLLGAISARVKANVIGILGANFLKQYHLVVDYSTGTLHN